MIAIDVSQPGGSLEVSDFCVVEEAPAIRLCPENEKIKLGHPAFYTKKQLLYCCCFDDVLPSLKLTFSHLKMDGWTTSFL